MAYKPTSAEISKAKEFVRRRIKFQKLAENEMSIALDKAAEDIAIIVAKYQARGMRLHFTGSSAMAKEIAEVIYRLERELERYLMIYILPDEADEENGNKAIKYALGMFHDATFDDREKLYLNNYIKNLVKLDFEDMDMDNEVFIEAIREAEETVEHRLLLLLSNTIAVSWMAYETIKAKAEGKKGFIVINGPNPCSFCKEMEGYHPIEDTPPLYHPNCQCIVVYI